MEESEFELIRRSRDCVQTVTTTSPEERLHDIKEAHKFCHMFLLKLFLATLNITWIYTFVANV